MRVCVRACVCVYVRACVGVCVRACVPCVCVSVCVSEHVYVGAEFPNQVYRDLCRRGANR